MTSADHGGEGLTRALDRLERARQQLDHYGQITSSRDEMIRNARAAGIGPTEMARRSGVSLTTIRTILGSDGGQP